MRHMDWPFYIAGFIGGMAVASAGATIIFANWRDRREQAKLRGDTE